MLVTFHKVEVSFHLLIIAQILSRQEMKGLLLELMLSCQTSNLKISHHQLANYVKKGYSIYDGNTFHVLVQQTEMNVLYMIL